MQLSFHGATRQVTGSCHLLETKGLRILVDCGLFQGGPHSDDENARPFAFDPRTVDVVLLTHAHLDHCGRLPLLVKRGFRGQIIATPPTRALARLVLLDAAKIQEEDARHDNRRGRRKGRAPQGPLFDTLDVLDVMDHFGESAHYGETLELARGVRTTYYDAGHILGAASVLVEADEGGGKRVLFSGDLGNAGKPLVRDPATPPEADAVVIETTYGDRLHRPFDASVDELYGVIEETFEAGGNVMIPAFALERSQELLYVLREGLASGQLPRRTKVFLDSPMAISATRIFDRFPKYLDDDVAKLLEEGVDPLDMPNLRFTRDVQDSMAINHVNEGAIIIAGSGMCTGGRIKHHIKHNAWRPECSLVFVAFAAKGTPARRIIDGERSVRFFGERVEIACRVETINGFSSHADADELRAWHAAVGDPGVTFLVHGEEEQMGAFAKTLEASGHRVEMPERGEAYSLTQEPA